MTSRATSILRSIATAPLRFYRRYLSPLKPPMCRFSPTCSQYAIEALETQGVLRGSGLALWRIARCHPLCKGGYDPVPPVRGGDHEHTGAPHEDDTAHPKHPR